MEKKKQTSRVFVVCNELCSSLDLNRIAHFDLVIRFNITLNSAMSKVNCEALNSVILCSFSFSP